MNLRARIREYIAACFTGLWLQSFEHEDALREIAQLCRQECWRLATWSIDEGLRIMNQATAQGATANDPLAAVRAVNGLAHPDQPALLVLVNFHRFLSSAEINQALVSQITAGKQNRTFILVLSPVVQIPIELEKLITVVEHDLPDRQQLAEIARGVAVADNELPTGEDLELVLDAAVGLTRLEAENAFALSLVRQQKITPETVWEQKAQTLKKSGLLELHRGRETFAHLGGLTALKGFCLRALLREGRRDSSVRPRGVLLLSPPGCGKSQFCKSLGNEIGRPTVTVDIGRLMGSLVGQSQANMRLALRTLDAMAPVVAFFDEIEKGWKGAAGSGVSDAGTTAQMFGEFLTWANDHQSDVFVVCTANDISSLPPEFSRAERFDAIFFIDLPGVQERRAIWQLYLEAFALNANQPKPVDADWSGAEIRACCRLAALLGVPLVEAARNVVPVARTAAEGIERLRDWAHGRCLSAEQPGIYQRHAMTEMKPRRKMNRDASQN